MKWLHFWLFGAIVGFVLGIAAGQQAERERVVKVIPAPPAPRVTDQQCVSWLFEANLKDVKKRICK